MTASDKNAFEKFIGTVETIGKVSKKTSNPQGYNDSQK